jgi:hypothetical protein
MLVFLLIVLIGGLGGFGYWAYSQGYLKGLPFLKAGSDNSTTSGSTGAKLTTPPKITDVKVNAGFVDGANVTWKTDQLASGQVIYGTTNSSLTSKTDVDTDPTTGTNAGSIDHAFNLKGLAASTKYYYQVISKNKDGLEAKSNVSDFTTSAQDQ